MTGAEDLVRRIAAQYDDEEGLLTEGALRRLAERQATAGKVCASCERALLLSAFGPNLRSGDGLEGRCRECLARARRESRAAKAVAA